MRNGLTIPYGTIQFGAGQGMTASAVNGMLEGWNVIDYNGSMQMTGDGPPATVTGGTTTTTTLTTTTTTTTTVPGNDTLVQ